MPKTDAPAQILENEDEYIVVGMNEPSQWVNPQGFFILEEDYRVSGEVWRVHKNDADPYPSKPHAHCVGGAARFVGCKLHLGTAELFSDRNAPLGRYLHQKQFTALIELIKPKFPDLKLPLE